MLSGAARFGPETYMKKAEEDIARVQLTCSLAEQPWDGYCGLVEVCEEDTLLASGRSDSSSVPSERPSARIEALTGDESTSESAASSQSFRTAAEPPEGRDEAEKRLLQRITQQIKDIAGVAEEQRNERLLVLAKQAYEAAKQCSRGSAVQLLRLAGFACPGDEARLRQEIEHAQREAGKDAGSPATVATTTAAAVPPSHTACPSQAQQIATHDAAAANRSFVAAKDAIKTRDLQRALNLLDEACRRCPPDKSAAKAQIQRYQATVEAALRQERK